MSQSNEITVEDNSKKVLSEFKAGIAKALEEIGITAEGYAKLKCPVDTGNLRNSIAHSAGNDGNSEYIGTNVEYAPYQELGTKYAVGKHFLKDAAGNHGGEYKQIVKNSLKS